jgi:hypothetical protein
MEILDTMGWMDYRAQHHMLADFTFLDPARRVYREYMAVAVVAAVVAAQKVASQ